MEQIFFPVPFHLGREFFPQVAIQAGGDHQAGHQNALEQAGAPKTLRVFCHGTVDDLLHAQGEAHVQKGIDGIDHHQQNKPR